eukprot:1137945-Pelagomonas_calceolata.AAC.2
MAALPGRAAVLCGAAALGAVGLAGGPPSAVAAAAAFEALARRGTGAAYSPCRQPWRSCPEAGRHLVLAGAAALAVAAAAAAAACVAAAGGLRGARVGRAGPRMRQ